MKGGFTSLFISASPFFYAIVLFLASTESSWDLKQSNVAPCYETFTRERSVLQLYMPEVSGRSSLSSDPWLPFVLR